MKALEFKAGLFVALVVAGGCVRGAPPPKVVRAAADAVVESAERNAQQAAKSLEVKAKADLFNSLAWFDERPGEVVLIRDRRGRIERLTGRYLAHEFPASLPPEPSRARAEAFFAKNGFGRTLLGLSRAEEIRFSRALLGRRERFLFEQYHLGRRILGATAVLDLDSRGRLAGLDAGLVGGVKTPSGAEVSEEVAIATAKEDLRQGRYPLWQEVEPEVESIERIVFDLLPDHDRDEFRNAYLVTLVPAAEASGGRREVVVDELTGKVLASIEKAKLMLDRDDVIGSVTGEIGCAGTGPGVVLWRGDEVCPSATDAPSGTEVAARDLDEASASFCETERLFAERGGEFGSADFHPWIDREDIGLNLGIGALPALSIGINTGGVGPVIKLAAGAARAEVIGHEFAHSLFGSAGSVAAFRGGGADGAAVEEHMGDLFGMLLESRFTRRNEDHCLLTDDSDSLAAIGSIAASVIPCRGQTLSWRSICEPWNDNGGWCEGPRTFLDGGSNRYDIGYPDGLLCDRDPIGYGISHTNLGIGNRQASALFKSAGSLTVLEGFQVTGIGPERSERLFLGAATSLPTRVSWSSYGASWITAAADLDAVVGVPMPPAPSLETNVRTALAGVKIWSLPKPVTVSTGLLSDVTRGTRPASASIIRSDGRERTYLFYRDDDFGDALYYVWRDEVAGGDFAEESEAPFQGPCRLGEARSRESPAAVGRDGTLYVAWAEPSAEADVGTVTGLRLQASDTVDTGCGDGWEFYPPGLRGTGGDEPTFAERRLKGAPALALWNAWSDEVSPPEEMFRCDPRLASPVPPNFPRFPIGPLGPQTWLFDICSFLPPSPQEPPQPLPPEFATRLRDLIQPVVESPAVRAIPSVFDPLGPQWVLRDEELEHDFAVETMLRSNTDFRGEFNQLMKDFDVEFRFPDAESVPVRAVPLSMALPNPGYVGPVPRFRIKYFLPNGPPSFDFSTPRQQLVLSFRDPENRLRVVNYADRSPTDSPDDGSPVIPVLAEGINDTDPGLAAVAMSPRRDYLVVVYGVKHNGRETGLAYRTLLATDSRGAWSEGSFTAEERIDQIRRRRPGTLRRRTDYAYARTFEAPAIAGGDRVLHLAVAELAHGSAVTPLDDPDYDPFPDTAGALADHNDHVRYASLLMSARGVLMPDGERPVRLSDTGIVSTSRRLRSGRQAQVGALQRTQHRKLLRFYLPNGAEVGVKSRVVR